LVPTGAATAMDIKSKRQLAVDFINEIRAMESGILNRLIVREAGEDLAQFFLSYSANLLSKDPTRALENASSLMLMGYLIRGHEDRNPATRPAPGAVAQA
jgi:hypothetical protein